MRENRKPLLTITWALAAISLLAGCKSNEPAAQKPSAEPQNTAAAGQTAATAEPASPSAALPGGEPLHTGKAEAKPTSAAADAKALVAPKKLTDKAPEAYKVKF